MKAMICLAATALIAAPSAANGQTPAPEPKHPPKPCWRKIDVRKAFDRSPDEDEPMSAGLISPGLNSQTYWLLDGGARLKPCTMYVGPDGPKDNPLRILWFPAVEWHHASAEPLLMTEQTNKGTASFNADFRYGNPDSSDLKAFPLAQGAITRDVLNSTTEKSASILVTFFQKFDGDGGFRPGSPLKYNNVLRGRYFPYVGVEYIKSLVITQDSDVIGPEFNGTVLTAKVDFEAMPFGSQQNVGEAKFVVSGGYAYRHVLKQVGALDSSNLDFLDISFTYYFTDDQSVGLGLTLDNGRSPTTNFVAQHRAALVLKAKL